MQTSQKKKIHFLLYVVPRYVSNSAVGEKMIKRLLIVVSYCFSNAPLQSTKSEGVVRDVLFRTSIL